MDSSIGNNETKQSPPAPLTGAGLPHETYNPDKGTHATMSMVTRQPGREDGMESSPLGVPWAVSAPGSERGAGAMALAPGYRLDRLVGTGGMGEVWEATQESLGRKVAIKKIKESKDKDSTSKSVTSMLSRSFKHEALITACLDHPNIVPVYDIGRDQKDEPLLAMKLVRGLSWDDLLKADRSLPYHDQLMKHLPILIDVAHAVAFAHSRGVLHRDIKPSQVMVGEFGEVLLLDWGVACYFTSGDHRETEGMFTADGHGPVPLMQAMNPAGTPAFMAPEQTVSTPEGLGPWTDVFLLGATLYYLLSEKTPYGHAPSSDAATLLANECNWKSLESLSNERRRIPPELIRVCARSMSKNAWERHASVNEFIDEVRSYLNGSGRRRESMELTNKALELLNSENTAYSVLSECGRLLTTARAVWDENPQVDEMEELLHERFAKAALERGDLALAREEAALLPEGKRRQSLLDLIGKRIAQQERLPMERLLYGVATVVLLVVSLGCLLVALQATRNGARQAAAVDAAEVLGVTQPLN